MSASQRPGKNSPDTTREEPPDIDAYAIAIPDAFLEGFDGDTVAEKLRAAEQAPAHDADTTADRTCPRCSSVRIRRKTGVDSQQTHETDWVCTSCRTHFDDPEHPEMGEIVFADDQVQLGRFADA
jgi:hypothetical protein